MWNNSTVVLDNSRHKITDLKVWKCNFLVTIRRITIEAYSSLILEKQNWVFCTLPAGTFDEITNRWEILNSPILREKQDDANVPKVFQPQTHPLQIDSPNLFRLCSFVTYAAFSNLVPRIWSLEPTMGLPSSDTTFCTSCIGYFVK